MGEIAELKLKDYKRAYSYFDRCIQYASVYKNQPSNKKVAPQFEELLVGTDVGNWYVKNARFYKERIAVMYFATPGATYSRVETADPDPDFLRFFPRENIGFGISTMGALNIADIIPTSNCGALPYRSMKGKEQAIMSQIIAIW